MPKEVYCDAMNNYDASRARHALAALLQVCQGSGRLGLHHSMKTQGRAPVRAGEFCLVLFPLVADNSMTLSLCSQCSAVVTTSMAVRATVRKRERVN